MSRRRNRPSLRGGRGQRERENMFCGPNVHTELGQENTGADGLSVSCWGMTADEAGLGCDGPVNSAYEAGLDRVSRGEPLNMSSGATRSSQCLRRFIRPLMELQGQEVATPARTTRAEAPPSVLSVSCLMKADTC